MRDSPLMLLGLLLIVTGIGTVLISNKDIGENKNFVAFCYSKRLVPVETDGGLYCANLVVKYENSNSG